MIFTSQRFERTTVYTYLASKIAVFYISCQGLESNGALIIFALFQYNANQELSKKVKNLEALTTSQEEEISKLNDLAISYDEALTEANNTIEEANSSIETAKYDAWNDYDSMGDALDMLDTFDTVATPEYTPYEYQMSAS